MKVVSTAALAPAYPVAYVSSLHGRGGFALGPASAGARGYFFGRR